MDAIGMDDDDDEDADFDDGGGSDDGDDDSELSGMSDVDDEVCPCSPLDVAFLQGCLAARSGALSAQQAL